MNVKTIVIKGICFLIRCASTGRDSVTNLSILDSATKFLHIALICSFEGYHDNTLERLHRDRSYSEFISFRVPFSCEGANNHQAVGIITVSELDKVIIVAFRGTCGLRQLWAQIRYAWHLRSPFEGGGDVMKYVVNAYDALQPQMEFALIRLKTKYPDFELLLCGHSLGGSIAQIAACSISKDELFLREKIQLITFGMPKIGNKKHAEAVNALVPRNLRVVNQWDLVRFLRPWLCHAGCEAVVEKSFWDFLCFTFPVEEHCGYLGFTTS